MVNLKDKTCLVIDNGLFLHFAFKLAEGFGKVKYWTPSIKAFPKTNDRLVGVGYPEIERVNERFEHIESADVLVYPDVGYGGEQVFWRRQGKAVWGAGYGEELELERVRTKKLLAKLGLRVGPYEVMKGVDALRKYLQNHKDVWVKLSAMRGDAETFNSQTYELVAPILQDLEARLGPKSLTQEFCVEDKLDAETEIGFDGFNVDGVFPSTGIMGIEVKDAGYIGAVKSYKDMPSVLTTVNNKLAPVLAKYEYRGLFSSEVRVTKERTPYLIDPCCRAGSPPSEVYVEMYSNWPEIVWGGAHGEIVTPKATCKYGVELMVESSWAEEHWQAVEVPKELRRWVKWKHPCVLGGQTYVIPNEQKIGLIGAVVGIGNTIQEAISKCLAYRKEVKGYCLQSDEQALELAVKEVEKARKVGVVF